MQLNITLSHASIMGYIVDMDKFSTSILHIRNFFQFRERVLIQMYESFRQMVNAIGFAIPPWVVGFNQKCTVGVLDLLAWEGERNLDFQQLLIHEFTHIGVRFRVQRCPLWLNEGLAMFFAGQQPAIENAIQKNSETGVYQLGYQHPDFYNIAGTIVQRLMDQYGVEQMRERLITVKDFYHDPLLGEKNITKMMMN